jgi:undecaprenyl diphosphate synthase
MPTKEEITQKQVPAHIAIIMDGNGRWARQKGKARIFGHKNALTAVREAIEGCAEIGVKYLTLYAFSTENWNRPKHEVNALMTLLVDSIHKELPTLMKNKIRLQAIGDIESLTDKCQRELQSAVNETESNNHMQLNLALSYSSRWEIIHAVKRIIQDAQDNKIQESELTEQKFESYLATSEMPDPELMIRTSGEYRISNFLLWQMAYSELCFVEKLWPDFRKDDLFQAVSDFQNRERRFGKTGEQIKAQANA